MSFFDEIVERCESTPAAAASAGAFAAASPSPSPAPPPGPAPAVVADGKGAERPSVAGYARDKAHGKPRARASYIPTNRPATQRQLAFLRDCWILLETAQPTFEDFTRWSALTAHEAHELIGTLWSEVSQVAYAEMISEVDLRRLALWDELSDRARAWVRRQDARG